MADRIVGYPPTITVATDVITFAAGEFDEAIFDTFTTSDYLIKTNGTPSTSQITAIGGLQGDGTYVITVTTGHGFVTGDRCSPQVGNTTLTYTTVKTAYTASSPDDILRIWRNAGNGGRWYGNDQVNLSSSTKMVSVYGMLPSQQIIFSHSNRNNFVFFAGDLSGNSNQAVIENLTILHNESVACRYDDTLGAGPGMDVRRCRISSTAHGIFIQGSGPINVENNIIFASGAAGNTAAGIYHYGGTSVLTARHNTILGCGYGIRGLNLASAVFENNVSLFNGIGDFSNITNATTGENWSSDVTSPDGAGNQSKTDADAGWASDDANNTFPLDWRISTSSSALAAGVSGTGVTLDIDGQTRPGTPSVGASEGISFSAAAPVVSGRRSGTYNNPFN